MRSHVEEAHPARRTGRAGGRRRQEGHQVLSHALLCSAAAHRQHGATWDAAAPGLRIIALPDEGHLDDDRIAEISLAVFSTDLWTTGQGRRFFRVALSAPNLRWLHVFAAGLDDPVFPELARRGVRITGSAGSSAVAIAHTTVMQLLALCRNARPLAVAQSEHRWAPVDHLDLEGRTVLIIGLGSIGREIARLLPHFGVRVVGIRRSPDGSEPCPAYPVGRLHDMLREADDIVVAASLDESTRGLIGEHELSLLPQHGHVVNVGRGELIDEAALVDALASGRLRGAALDVFSSEPLSADSPLWDMPNVIVTPHVAGRTPLSTERAAAVFTDNLGRWTRGEPLRNEFVS